MDFLCPCFTRRTGKYHEQRASDIEEKSSDAQREVVQAEKLQAALKVKSTSTCPPQILEQLQQLTEDQRRSILDDTDTQYSDLVSHLEKRFLGSGIESKVARLAPSLHTLEKFVGSITTICQAGPGLLQIVWGSVRLILSLSLRFVAAVDRIVDCFVELTNSLPRLNEYIDLFPTLRLKQALSDIYVTCIEFCVATVKFLDRSPTRNFIGLLWSPLDQELASIQKSLAKQKAEFGDEVQALYVTTIINWQRRMEANTAVEETFQPQRMLLQPRNYDFTGQTTILKQLETIFCPENGQTPSEVVSCTLHGVGGVGKTAIALEFAHRMETRFDYVLWLGCETELELSTSFVDIARQLGFHDSKLMFEENEQRTRRWLNTINKRCLLVYDNVDETKFLGRYWPQNPLVSALVTSQHTRTSALTSNSIHVLPMDNQEGGELFMRLSHLDAAPETASLAQALSHDLGGLPLALAHYAGYLSRSQMTLFEFHTVFKDHFQDALIWTSDSPALKANYSKTLQTAWSSSTSKISPEAKSWLSIIAYLHPDCVPEMMLLDFSTEEDNENKVKKLMKLRVAIMDLQDRHLVERSGSGESATLRTHRALKQTIILGLAKTPEERQEAFDKAVASVRRSLPRRALIKGRSGADGQKLVEIFLPHVLNLEKEYRQADPPLKGSMEFADLLCDAAFYLWETQLLTEAISAALTSDRILREVLGPDARHPLRTQIAGCLAVFYHIDGRRAESYDLYMKAIELQEEYIASLSPDKVTETDKIDLARSQTDASLWFMENDRFDEALDLVEKGMAAYRELGDETTLTYRYGNQYNAFSMIYCGQRRLEDGILYGRKCYALISKLYGERYYWSTVFQFNLGAVLLIAGETEEAKGIFESIFNTHVELRGEEDQETLNSMVWVATAHYYLNEFAEAEKYLRKAISLKDVARWRENHAARAMLRLAAVLEKQGKKNDAEEYVQMAMREAPDVLGKETRSIDEHLEVCERTIFLWLYGRFTGSYLPVEKGVAK